MCTVHEDRQLNGRAVQAQTAAHGNGNE